MNEYKGESLYYCRIIQDHPMQAVHRKLRTFFQKEEDVSRRLNLDVLLSIFSYIDIETLVLCARVCKRWRQAAYHPTLWRAMTVTVTSDKQIKRLTAKSFGERNITSYRIYLEYRSSCSNPQARYGDKISASIAMLSRHAKIESLVIRSVADPSCKCRSTFKLNMFSSNKKTQHAKLTTNLCFDSTTAANLQYLVVNVKCSDLKLSPDNSAYQFTNLKQLILRSNSESKNIYGCSFDDLFHTFPNLIDLEMGRSWWVFFEVPSTAQNHKLERLALKLWRVEPERFINWISYTSIHFPNLRHLDIEFTIQGFGFGRTTELPVLSFPALQSLRLTTLDIGESITSVASLFTKSPKLTALELWIMNHCGQNESAYSNHMNLTQFFPKLRLLRLRLNDVYHTCDSYESRILVHLVHMVHTMTQLDTLVLLGRWQLSEAQLRSICDNSTSLNRLVVCRNDVKSNGADNDRFGDTLDLEFLWKQNIPVMFRKRDVAWELTTRFSDCRADTLGTRCLYPQESKVLFCHTHHSCDCLTIMYSDCRLSLVSYTDVVKT